MSDLPNHDHDPDPAALDELQRAFADDEPDAERDDAPDPGVDPEAVRETDAVPVVDPGVDPEAVRETDVVPVVDPGVDPEAVRETDVVPVTETVEPEGDPRDGSEVAPASGERPSDDSEAAVEPVSGEAVVDEDGSDGPGDDAVLVVEPEPDAQVGVIRIDDFAGSAEITGDATPESLAERPATAPVGAGDGADAAHGGVISISDDDLPDPVYVKGSLDADGSGTIVFIEDDDTGDVLGPESERDLRRGIEPRMRERRVAVRRAQGRRRLVRFGIVAAVALLIVAVLAVLGSPLFAVREGDVEVYGVRYADEARLQEIIDDAIGTAVLRLDTDQVEADIEAIPWVDDASVSTDFPHGLVIDIRERAAWTTYRGPDGRYRVLDREGRVLDVLDMYPFAYVTLVGPDPVDLEAGEFAPQGYVAASELAKNLTGSMRGRVTEIEVTADGSRLAVHLDDGSTVLFGEARDLLAKLVRLEVVLTNGEECEPGLIDVSTDDVTRCELGPAP